jgi:hypothetical protein
MGLPSPPPCNIAEDKRAIHQSENVEALAFAASAFSFPRVMTKSQKSAIDIEQLAEKGGNKNVKLRKNQKRGCSTRNDGAK